MSSYSFSHQFYQHWTGAPEPVRAAIVQELTDITDLLQNKTLFEKFVFSTHDLDAHLDDLYCAHELQQTEIKKIADKEATLAAQQEQRKVVQAEQEKEDLRQQELAQKKQAEQAALKAEVKNSTNNVSAVADSADNEENKNDSANKKDFDKSNIASIKNIKAVSDTINKQSAIDLSLASTELNATHEDMIHELQMHIDDYLSEQMMQMSENLKSWLRAEISRQLAEKPQVIDSDVKK